MTMGIASKHLPCNEACIRTFLPCSLEGAECPRSACGALACRELLHSRWLDTRRGLFDGDQWAESNPFGTVRGLQDMLDSHRAIGRSSERLYCVFVQLPY